MDDEQGDLFSAKAGKADGMRRVEENADDRWKNAALVAVYRAAYELDLLTSDDVWERLPAEVETHENRAMGPVMRNACRLQWITPTEVHIKGRRASRHRAPLQVWKSLLRQ
jgi:hypothetical protein